MRPIMVWYYFRCLAPSGSTHPIGSISITYLTKFSSPLFERWGSCVHFHNTGRSVHWNQLFSFVKLAHHHYTMILARFLWSCPYIVKQMLGCRCNFSSCNFILIPPSISNIIFCEISIWNIILFQSWTWVWILSNPDKSFFLFYPQYLNSIHLSHQK